MNGSQLSLICDRFTFEHNDGIFFISELGITHRYVEKGQHYKNTS